QHRQDAKQWRRCFTKSGKKQHKKLTRVQWSELLRLPYFNPIQFLAIDPMHCLFLDIAKWIVPSDIGQIPRKVDCGEGFANFTADEWKIFILIYATPCLWDYLSALDQRILTNFVRICTIL
ncbi:13329_t:CDS:2, partial [Ambispora leptoticha]